MLNKKQNRYLILKRTIDVAGSLTGIIVLSPMLLFVTLITCVTSKGGPFFVQKRLGKDKKIFKMIKFRSMKKDAIQVGQEGLTSEQEKAMATKWGSFMRKTSIDETPQLFNILIGDMSFIGPRPGMVANSDGLVEARESFIPSAYEVKPGLSGYAQIHMKRGPDVIEKAREDSYYVQHLSFSLDIKLFIHSFVSAINNQGN